MNAHQQVRQMEKRFWKKTNGFKSAFMFLSLWAAAAAARISQILTSVNRRSDVISCKILSPVVLQSGHCGLVVAHRWIHVKQNVCMHGSITLQSFLPKHIVQWSIRVDCTASMAAWTSRWKVWGVVEGMFSCKLKSYQMKNAWLHLAFILIMWRADWLIRLKIIIDSMSFGFTDRPWSWFVNLFIGWLVTNI